MLTIWHTNLLENHGILQTNINDNSFNDSITLDFDRNRLQIKFCILQFLKLKKFVEFECFSIYTSLTDSKIYYFTYIIAQPSYEAAVA